MLWVFLVMGIIFFLLSFICSKLISMYLLRLALRASLARSWGHPIRQAFFLTPPAEKTKTQGQNSSKKLKEKTQPLGGLSLPYAKLKKKTKITEILSSKLKVFQRVALFIPFLLTNIFKNREI